MGNSAEQDKATASTLAADEVSHNGSGLHLPSTEELKGKWKEHLGAAKIVWGKLTDDELLRAEGEVQQLAGLIQQRYAVSREEAERQVKQFLDTHKS
jgi:uncharacterized protein YjbJ (UPF0337 family)